MLCRYWYVYVLCADTDHTPNIAAKIFVTFVICAWASLSSHVCDVATGDATVTLAAALVALVHDAFNPNAQTLRSRWLHGIGMWPDVMWTSTFSAWVLLHVRADCSVTSYAILGVVAAALLIPEVIIDMPRRAAQTLEGVM